MDMGKILITTKPLPYEKWIQDWTSQPVEPVTKLRVPAAATRITSPLIIDNWRIMLADYPNRPLVNFFKMDFALALPLAQPRLSQPNETCSVHWNTQR